MWASWLIVAILLMIGEILTPGFVLACFSIGCLASSVAAFFTSSLSIQLIIFVVVSLLVFIFIRPLLKFIFFNEAEEVKTNVDALVGKLGVVMETINPKNHVGRVKVGGEDWKAITEDRSVIEEGMEVKVLKVEGTKVIVVPIHPDSA